MASARDLNDSSIGSGCGEAVCGWDNRPSVERKRSLTRIFDLLHSGEYRRSAWPYRRVACTKTAGMGDRKRVSRGCFQRFPDVLDDSFLLSRAGAFWRTESSKRLHR